MISAFRSFPRVSLVRKSFSKIVHSPYKLPDNFATVTNTSVPRYVMADFLRNEVSGKVAICDGATNASKTYGQLHAETHKFAHSLQDMGFGKGDVIGIMSPNHVHYFTCFQGIGLIGATSTPILTTTAAKAAIAHPMCLDKVKSVANALGIPVFTLGQGDANVKSIDDIIAAQTKATEVNVDVGADAIATIPFSSGTTGVPKGVVLSHRNIVANLEQLMEQEGKYLVNGVMICPLPFFHIFGMVVGVLMGCRVRAKVVFQPAFDLERFLQLIQEHKVTRAYVVPPIILALAKHPLVDKYDLSSLKAILSGAAPLGGDVQEGCAVRLKCIVKQAWGMTELSPAGACTADDEVTTADNRKGRSGHLVPGTEGLIVDPLTGDELDRDEEGELLLRGPQVMRGYLNNEEATKNTIRPDGFMHTGDIAKFDKDGWLYITDRCKELIKYKGFQVAPAELEAIMNNMPVVRDVVVIPVPCDEAGEIPRAYVALQPNAKDTTTEQDILDHVHALVAPHKRLRGGVVFADEIPRSASGKLLRRVQIEIDRQSESK